MNLSKFDFRKSVRSPIIYSLIFIGAIISLLYLASITYRQLVRVKNEELKDVEIYKVSSELTSVFANLLRVEKFEHEYLSSKDSNTLETINQILNETSKKITALDNLTEKPIQNPYYAGLKENLHNWQKLNSRIGTEVTEDSSIGVIQSNQLLVTGEYNEKISLLLDKFNSYEQQTGNQNSKNPDSLANLTPISYFLAITFSLVIFTFSFYRIIRDRGHIISANQNITLQNLIISNAEQNSLSGTYALNHKNEPIYISDNIFRLLGYEPGDVKMKKSIFVGLEDTDDIERIKKNREALWASSGSASWDFTINSKTGNSKHFREYAEILSFGRKPIMIGMLQDISKDRIAKNQLEAKNKELSLQNTIFTHSEASALVGTCIWNITKQKFTCSDNFKKLLGQDIEFPLSSPHQLLSYLPKEEQLSTIQLITDSLQNKKQIQRVFEITIPERGVKYMRMTGTYVSVTDEDYAIGTFQDITNDILLNEKLQSKDAQLKRSELNHNLMINEVEDYAIILLNQEGIIENWNKGAEKIKGYKEKEIIGKSFSIFYTEEERYRHVPQQLLKIAESEGRARHEGWRIRKDGSQFWGSTVITAIHDENDKTIGFTKVTRDLTAQRIFEENNEKSRRSIEMKNAELEQINKELSTFNHMASHDLQEPLRKIQTFISIIKEDESNELTETSSLYFEKIRGSANRMQKLIQDLIDYSYLRSEQVVEAVNLNIILQNVLQELTTRIEENGVQIKVTTLPEIKGIPFQLEQLFTNLIDNSIKYRHTERTSVISISSDIIRGSQISTDVTPGNREFHRITIHDNGIGFDNQYADSIFNLFQRLHGKSDFSGTGIGLAICKKVMHNHHGFIAAEGHPGIGSTFFLYFPVS